MVIKMTSKIKLHMDTCNCYLLRQEFHSVPPHYNSNGALDVPTDYPLGDPISTLDSLTTHLLTQTASFRYSKRLSQKLWWKSDQKRHSNINLWPPCVHMGNKLACSS